MLHMSILLLFRRLGDEGVLQAEYGNRQHTLFSLNKTTMACNLLNLAVNHQWAFVSGRIKFSLVTGPCPG